MSKKTQKAKAAAAAAKSDAGPKKSKLKLALLALVPLVLAGGGYGGWTYFAGEATAKEDPGTDTTHVAAIPPEVAAESSFTYSFALSELLKSICGPVKVPALQAAAAAEAHADGTLANLSWMAANRRLASVTDKSCSQLRAELGRADSKAEAALAAAGGAEKAKPAAH